MKKINRIASALGKLAAGHPKSLTQAERARRAARMRKVNEQRLAALRAAKH